MNQSSNSAPAPDPFSGVSLQADQTAQEIVKLNQQAKNSSRSFYWIAGLSFINSLITAFGGEFYLVMGLASTLFVDYLAVGMGQSAPEAVVVFKVVALVVSVIASGVFALFGFLAEKGKRWAYVFGMVFYGVDALIMLALQEWKGLLVHLYFMWVLFSGLRALNQLQKIIPQTARPSSDFPQNIGTS